MYGEWGQFQKHHEFMASLVLSLVWMAAFLNDCKGTSIKAWMSFLGLAAGHCVLFTPTMYPLIFGMLGLVWLVSLLHRAWGVAWAMLAGLGVTTAVLAGVMTINYACTGLAEVTPMRTFWKYADQERFSHWVSPYMMTLLLEGSSPELGTVGLMNCGIPRLTYLKALARTNVAEWVFPDINSKRPLLLLGVLIAIGVRLATKKKLRFPAWHWRHPCWAYSSGRWP